MKTHLTITPADLDAALAVPWSPQSCILAQCAKREGLEYSGISLVNEPGNEEGLFFPAEASNLRREFDRAYSCLDIAKESREEAINKLRAKLPITFKLDVQS